MKTGIQNHKMFAILMCMSLVLMAVLACRVPGRGRLRDEESQSEQEQGGEALITDAGQQGTESALPCYQGIVPGKSNRAEVVGLLGQPVHSEQDGMIERLLYSSSASSMRDIIELTQDFVSTISIVFSEERMPRLSELQRSLGQPEHTTYSTFTRGSRAYLYPQQGLMLIADPMMDVVFIQECFVPQTLADFMSRYGVGLPETDPFIRGAASVEEPPAPPASTGGVVLTDRRTLESLLIYPGARVIHDDEDQYTELFGLLILAVDSSLDVVIDFYQAQYKEGFTTYDISEFEAGGRGVDIINDSTLPEIRDALTRSGDPEAITHSITTITIQPAQDFDRPEYTTQQAVFIDDYSENEILIIFNLSNIQKMLEAYGEG